MEHNLQTVYRYMLLWIPLFNFTPVHCFAHFLLGGRDSHEDHMTEEVEGEMQTGRLRTDQCLLCTNL